MKEHPAKTFPTIGCCGLDCGLCPRYYTAGSSRCPGCAGPDFFEKHPSCGYITCCVKKKGLEVCAQCGEFPCTKFEAWLGNLEQYDSFLTHQRTRPNLDSIRTHGIESFMKQQRKRMTLLNTMLESFDDGRAKSFYCVAATLLPVTALEESLHRAQEQVKKDNARSGDIKDRAAILRGLLDDCAAKTGVELKLRQKRK